MIVQMDNVDDSFDRVVVLTQAINKRRFGSSFDFDRSFPTAMDAEGVGVL